MSKIPVTQRIHAISLMVPRNIRPILDRRAIIRPFYELVQFVIRFLSMITARRFLCFSLTGRWATDWWVNPSAVSAKWIRLFTN